MRWFVLLCSAVLATVWLLPEAVVAGSTVPVEQAAPASKPMPPVDPLAHAQSLEESLRAVEWYTNEAVRKALNAETAGDFTNARLFGDKAIESDKKARDLRNETAAAWLAVQDTSNATAVWFRAAGMAEERALMLANRIPSLSAQWHTTRQTQPAADAVALHEQEVIYLQAVFLTAQQWAVTADFFTRAAEPAKAAQAKAELQRLLPLLLADARLQALGDDARLKDAHTQALGWQAGRLP